MPPIISLFLFFIVARASTRLELGTVFPSVIVVGVPFVVTITIKSILYGNSGLPVENIISWSSVLLVVLQFVVALITFKRLQNADDSIAEWLLWTAGGALVVVFFLPNIIK